MKRVVIVGGGIAGLSIAHALKRRLSARPAAGHVEVVALEKGDRPGGNIRTDMISGYLCEWGPNGFLDNVPETLELVRAIGIEGAIQVSDESARKRFIFRGGHLHELPEGIGSFLASRLLSWTGKLRIAWEPLAPKRPDGDETIHAFAARRIGREAADILIDSMVSGVFAGDSRELSLRACFPKMWQMETDHGGLFRATLALRKRKRAGERLESLRPVGAGPAEARKEDAPLGAPTGKLTSFREGTETLIKGLVRALGGILRTNARVEALTERSGPAGPGGHVAVADPSSAPPRFLLDVEGAGEIEADVVVLAGPSSDSARLLRPIDTELAAELDAIPTAPIVVVCFGYEEARIPEPLDGFGFLVPRGEGARILGCLWDSSVYPGRAPRGKVLVRVMIGGARDPEAIDLSDEDLLEVVRADLARTMGLALDPEFVRIFRHPLGIPQYTTGHLERLARLDARLGRHPGLFLAGNSYRGVSMNSCIAEAGPLADGVLAHLERAGVPSTPASASEATAARRAYRPA